jgi:uncharacterized phiE125 gp8 family phage protein
MKWTGTRPTDPCLVTYGQMQSQLRIVSDDEQDYVDDVVDACIDYAEQALDASLLIRAITAIYYDQAGPYYGVYRNYHRLALPRGPVQSVTSVTDANGTITGFTLEGEGNTDILKITQAWTAPLTVVFVAGFGSNVTDVPADIRMAIRTHAATLFEQRASTDEKAILPVPHSLEAFYQLRRRSSPVG